MKESGGPLRHQQTLKSGDEVLNLFGFRYHGLKTFLFHLFTVLTAGILRLVMHWKPAWNLRLRTVPCSFEVADLILITDNHKTMTVVKVEEKRRPINYPLLLPRDKGGMREVESYRWFLFRKLTYVWIEEKEGLVESGYWISPSEIDGVTPLSVFHKIHQSTGFNGSQVLQRRSTYGTNEIIVELRSYFNVFIYEVISPFYIFQLFSVTIWYNDEYSLYATVIVFMSLTGIVMEVYNTRKQEKKLRSMVHNSAEVEVKRDGRIVTVHSSELVPGDIICISPTGGVLQCDAILMTGTVIVNEAMLTGESVPVTKVALPDDGDDVAFNIDHHSKHVLFGGTNVLQTRYYHGKKVEAIVLRSAYSTLKGSLVRSIMYPKPVDFSFTKDLVKFVLFLSFISGMGFIYTIIIMYYRGATFWKIVIRAADIITITVPPALPAAMSIGMVAARMRLKAKEIFAISPSVINTCGGINVVCFDKTGTLTEDGLDFHVMRAVTAPSDSAPAQFCEETSVVNRADFPKEGELITAIATCHSLTRINGKLMGDPLDEVLFKKTGWVLEEPTKQDGDGFGGETELFDQVQPSVIKPPSQNGEEVQEEYSVIRQFTFSSSLQRMSVIVYNPIDDRMFLYCKGSPEMIYSLCDKTTVPEDYLEKMNDYAEHGYRLIAVARVELDLGYPKAVKIAREKVECSLELLGLVAMENRVKEQTYDAIPQLIRANIRCVMVTGDNVLTALSVARECGIIRPEKKTFILEHSLTDEKDEKGRTRLILKQSVSASPDLYEDEPPEEEDPVEFKETTLLVQSSYQICISGPTFAVIIHEYPELLNDLVCVCDVFARMSPDQKQQLVNHLQEVGYTVAMCGDGANDCAALKAAHAGISLSESEASIAAPFTSKVQNISCVPIIISEGRCALVTSFGMFKYMAGYSLNQFITCMLLYSISNILTDGMFIFIDLVLISSFGFVFGCAHAYPHLHKTPPPINLLSWASIVGVMGQLIMNGGFQLLVFWYITYQDWFVPYVPPSPDDEKEDKRSMQGTAIFYVSVFQYITLAIVYSKGPPYRCPLWENKPFLIVTVLTILTSIFILVSPNRLVVWALDLVILGREQSPEMLFYLLIAAVVLVNVAASFGFDYFVVEKLIAYVEMKQKKRRLVASLDEEDNPTDKDRKFEKTLLKIGAEPGWLRKVTSTPTVSPIPVTVRSVMSNGTTMTSISEIAAH